MEKESSIDWQVRRDEVSEVQEAAVVLFESMMAGNHIEVRDQFDSGGLIVVDVDSGTEVIISQSGQITEGGGLFAMKTATTDVDGTPIDVGDKVKFHAYLSPGPGDHTQRPDLTDVEGIVTISGPDHIWIKTNDPEFNAIMKEWNISEYNDPTEATDMYVSDEPNRRDYDNVRVIQKSNVPGGGPIAGKEARNDPSQWKVGDAVAFVGGSYAGDPGVEQGGKIIEDRGDYWRIQGHGVGGYEGNYYGWPKNPDDDKVAEKIMDLNASEDIDLPEVEDIIKVSKDRRS